MATKLVVAPCRCIRRGDCHVPGTKGHLFARIGARVFFLRRCTDCCERADENVNLLREAGL